MRQIGLTRNVQTVLLILNLGTCAAGVKAKVADASKITIQPHREVVLVAGCLPL
jgi:hypothetical protein